MAALEQLDDGLWVAAAPQTFMGMHLGTRMTVVQRPDGGAIVHSALALDDALRAEIEAIGPVRCVIAPNLYHHLFAGQWAAAFPEVRLVGPKALADKRKDLKLDAFIDETADAGWAGTLDHVRVQGCMLQETVFFHRPSRTLISSDFVENFETSPHWPTRVYLKAAGIHGKPGVSRMLRPMYRDHDKVKTAIERVLAWDFQRIVLAHGDVVAERGPQVVRDSYAWL